MWTEAAIAEALEGTFVEYHLDGHFQARKVPKGYDPFAPRVAPPKASESGPPRRGVLIPWTDEDSATLLRLRMVPTSIDKICAEMRRGREIILEHIELFRSQGVVFPEPIRHAPSKMPPELTEQVEALMYEGVTIADMVKRLNSTRHLIRRAIDLVKNRTPHPHMNRVSKAA
jgi:hypothetical protein